MYSSLDDVEFLVRSPSRMAVLDAIHEAPRTRDELKESTDASRTTLSRMLADFEDRGWVERTNSRYQSTPEGAFVASEVTRLLENMETAEKLDGALRWLPTDEFGFDLRHLRDAEIITLQWNDPASMRLLAEHLDGASRVRSMADSVSREVVDILRELTVEGGGTYEGILSPGAIEIIREHPALREQVREMLGSGRATVYRYDGEEVRSMVMCFDDVVALCNHASGGPRMEGIMTDDATVRSWAESYFDSVRTDAECLDVEAFVP
jgi:predicted transcriptional regulator